MSDKPKDPNHVWVIWSNIEGKILGVAQCMDTALSLQCQVHQQSMVSRVARSDMTKVFSEGVDYLRKIA